MWLRTVRFIFKEGFSNFFRNKLMFFASCAIIMTSLVILGAFLLIIFNVDSNLRAFDETPQVVLHCDNERSPEEIDELEAELRGLADSVAAASADTGSKDGDGTDTSVADTSVADGSGTGGVGGVKEFTRVSDEEAYARARDMLEEDAYIVDEMGADFLPVTFIVRMDSSSALAEFARAAERVPFVLRVIYPEREVNSIVRLTNWSKLFGVILVGFPILCAVFIVSNTIKLAVSERSGEIGIMRYIGATENMIRWPFVVEGMIIGLFGATLAFFMTGFGYRFLENSFNSEMSGTFGNLVRLIDLNEITPLIIMLYLVIGVGVGALGSARSIRTYLKL